MSNGLNVSSFLHEGLPQLRHFLKCPELVLNLNEDWSADHKEGRSMIREALSNWTQESHHDLSSPPRSKSYSISISHCSGLGGFACVPLPHSIGFDVEVTDRVKDAIAARISTPEEKSMAPTPALLWAAKEAAFKSLLGSHQPPHFTVVVTEGWLKLGQPLELEGKPLDIWQFQASMSQTDSIPGVGVAFLLSKYTFAIFYRSNLST